MYHFTIRNFLRLGNPELYNDDSPTHHHRQIESPVNTNPTPTTITLHDLGCLQLNSTMMLRSIVKKAVSNRAARPVNVAVTSTNAKQSVRMMGTAKSFVSLYWQPELIEHVKLLLSLLLYPVVPINFCPFFFLNRVKSRRLGLNLVFCCLNLTFVFWLALI